MGAYWTGAIGKCETLARLLTQLAGVAAVTTALLALAQAALALHRSRRGRTDGPWRRNSGGPILGRGARAAGSPRTTLHAPEGP